MPGLLIVVTVLAFSTIADGFRVALDTSISQHAAADDADVEAAPYDAVPTEAIGAPAGERNVLTNATLDGHARCR